MNKRFIEDSFPVKEVSEESAREKNIRHNHISTIHIWWARRPLASSRATNYASLIPSPQNPEEWEEKRKFIIELSKWENSLDKRKISIAKKDILEFNGGSPPKIFDPFSGGGAIPLEALRLGCEVYANDYNPIAFLIEKCTLEYPQKYSQKINQLVDKPFTLTEDIKKWGSWVWGETLKEIEQFYPINNDEIPIGYIWARTLECQNPSCKATIPLMRQFWLANKKNRKISLLPLEKNGEIEFEILNSDKDFPSGFDPKNGTISRSTCRCLICGTPIEAKMTRSLFKKGESGEKMVAVVYGKPKIKGKNYRTPTNQDLTVFEDSKQYLIKKIKYLHEKWGFSPLPNEEIPLMSGTFNVPLYGINEWSDLFNYRQKLAILTLLEKIREANKKINEVHDEEYALIITTYLALALNRLASFSTSFCRWKSGTEQNIPLFSGRSALPMIFDYFEVNPLGKISTSWINCINTVVEPLESLKNLSPVTEISNFSADSIGYPDNFFDAVFTDPPYYNSVPYADLSDFFYVWAYRSIGNLYPSLFVTPVTPKSKEIVEMAGWDKKRYGNKDQSFFEERLKKSFEEINRVLKPNGIATIVYAHKTTEGWETVINALLDSGLTVTASWPISTEMATRLRAKKSAALASSIYIVARKVDKEKIGWYTDVKEEIKNYIPKKLDKLWREGISGADFFIAAIGSAIEVFGKYEKVLDFEGNEIRANKLLSYVRDVVTDYAVRHILHNGIADELSPLTKFYLLWRWNYQELNVSFDEARKLAQSAGIDLTSEWNKGFIKKKGELIIVQGPSKREKNSFNNSVELVDVLHNVLLLWNDGKESEMIEILEKTGYGNKEAFYKVAQAVSETLPNTSNEKKLLDGFLSGKNKLIKNMGGEAQQKLV